MGNAPSNNDKPVAKAFANLLKTSNALGLSKQELEERCRPSGLYPKCEWDDKAIRRLIGDGKLAARRVGSERIGNALERECPICFLSYQDINVTKCCQANICTECYLQVKPVKSQCSCPYCNTSRLDVMVAKPPPPIHDKPESCGKPSGTSTPPPQPETYPKEFSTPTSGFGSSLEQNERVAMMRMRSSSLGESTKHLQPEEEISSLAMTPDERRILEQEMRAQHHHPLTMRLEQEEAERRLRNELEYYRRNNNNNSSRSSNRQPQHAAASRQQPPQRQGRDWNRIVEAFENGNSNNNNNNGNGRGGGGGNVMSLDDLVVLEAAIVLSMEEEARIRGGEPAQQHAAAAARQQLAAERHASANFPLARARVQNSSGASRLLSSSPSALGNAGRLSEEEQIAMAIEASLRESDLSPNNSNSASSSSPGGNTQQQQPPSR